MHRINGIIITCLVAAHPVLIKASENFIPYTISKKYYPEFVGIALLFVLLTLSATAIFRKFLKMPYPRWRLLHRLGATLVLLIVPAHLTQYADIAMDQVIGKMHEKRFLADDRSRAQNGVPETERCPLAQIDAIHVCRDDFSDVLQQLVLAALFERSFEFCIDVEMILDGPFCRARDEDQLLDACFNRFLNCILDQWLVHDRQHLLWRSLGCR